MAGNKEDEKPLSREEIQATLTESLKQELAKRERREKFDLYFANLVAAKHIAFAGSDLYDLDNIASVSACEALRMLDIRQDLIDKGKL